MTAFRNLGRCPWQLGGSSAQPMASFRAAWMAGLRGSEAQPHGRVEGPCWGPEAQPMAVRGGRREEARGGAKIRGQFFGPIF